MKLFREPKTDPCSLNMNTGRRRGLVHVDYAIETVLALASEVPEVELVGLDKAIGRVLGGDLYTSLPLPLFDNSAMDGYAVHSDDFENAGPWTLKVTGVVAAGDNVNSSGTVGKGEAFRIFTGAGIPKGADAVIMQEYATRSDNIISISDAISSGSCIRRKGEDLPAGSLLLSKGTLIGAPEIGAIASAGIAKITVRRKIKIAFICTGSELCQPGEHLCPGQIYNSNRFMMLGELRQQWADVIDHGTVEDDPDLLCSTLRKAAENSDIVVTTGGVSVGDEDHMVSQLKAAGGKIEIVKIAMKPGKPFSVGTLSHAVFIGLPGNPVAAFTTWKIIGSQVAAKMSGQSFSTRAKSMVEIVKETVRRPGRQEYRPSRIVGTSKCGLPQVEFLDQTFSARVSMLCKSDGFVIIPPEIEKICAGERFEFVYL